MSESAAWPQALCCGFVKAHKEIGTHWDAHVDAFLTWLAHNGRGKPAAGAGLVLEFTIRLTTSINFGRDCGAMEYGALVASADGRPRYKFVRIETNSGQLQGHTHRRAFKNYKCQVHGLFYQLDLYTT
ncbi:hypothetical protein AURDEDRAFT_156054 [Auricularia subglabra TFB-10046 SS5]|nr:hypothetical protein AURDEDRAFT_156054 [Auricularia subglabra TFB-10046 SS5]